MRGRGSGIDRVKVVLDWREVVMNVCVCVTVCVCGIVGCVCVCVCV